MTSAPLFDKPLIRARLERRAAARDVPDFLLLHAVEEIADRVGAIRRPFDRIAAVGCYHGAMARSLRTVRPQSQLVSLCQGVALARLCPPPAVVADEEALPLKDSSLDLIASALSLHVVNDLPGALVQIRRALRPDGLFIGALLGGDTLIELRHAFAIAESEILGGVSPRVFPTASLQDTGGLLQRAGFALPVSDSEKVTVTYASPLALMNDLRSMGASNSLLQRSRRPLRRDVLARAAGVYSDLYGGGGKVAATFEVLYLSGWAPHASQQKPLKPGSAAMRLSDALNSTDLSAGDKASFRREPPAPEKGS